MWLRLAYFLWTQLKLLISPKPDVIYVRTHFASWPTAFFARLRGIPMVQEVNGPYKDLFIAYPITQRLARLFELLVRLQLRWANAIIAVTPRLAEWARRESGNSPVWVIPNGVNTELFNPDAPLMVSVPDTFVVFFGALAPWQGIDTMLAAVERPEWPLDVKLVIVGDGVERPKVEVAACKGKVVYLGTVPYAQVPGIVARSIAGLSPQGPGGGRSKMGLYPLKVFETLGCGVPVIVTDFPGQADLVKEGKCGLVIPPEDPRALAQAVAYLYSNPEERMAMGRQGRKLVEREHSWDQRAEQVDSVLRSVLRDE
jgi:glycosyltransferase involved in cell wall biosynthesis